MKNVCCNVCQKTQIKKSGGIRRKNTINNYYTKKGNQKRLNVII